MGTPGPAAKRHHYVPQFHLRGFADGETITTVELPGDRSYTQPVRKAAAENHLYSLPGHPDGADVFEKELSQLESEVAKAQHRTRTLGQSRRTIGGFSLIWAIARWHPDGRVQRWVHARPAADKSAGRFRRRSSARGGA
ncbi:DUF4238 domain-containing protein [Microbacterium oxydans]|uniref:DUF4238 domain-containing protein n=1 Tax=Microbacterium oxydans TaxID=82380 RepID=UPI0037CA31FA